MEELLPHLNGALNGVTTILLVAGFVAIRRGERALHPRLMLSAVGVGIVFLLCYVLQVWSLGHQRFPGADWVRSLFVAILGTHTLLAVAVVPLVLRVLYLARQRRLPEHRRTARIAFPVWLYVSLTGIVIYWMNNHLRPPG